MTLSIFYYITFSASALKCWTCENAWAPFCGDRFDYNMLTEQDKYNHYHECIGERCLKVAYSIDCKYEFFQFDSDCNCE